MQLTIDEAKEFVRTRLDELAQTDSDMLADSVDDRNLGLTVEKLLPGSITAVHMAAPASLIDNAVSYTQASTDITSSVTDKVLDINFASASAAEILRLVSFKCGDGILVTAEYPEDSPEARMQNDTAVRGRGDEPVLVRMSDSASYRPHYKYYTTELATVAFDLRLLPVPTEQTSSGSMTYKYYDISSRLRNETLNYLTAMVLIAYNQGDKASFFFTKANIK